MKRLIRPAAIKDPEDRVDGEPFYMLQQLQLSEGLPAMYFRSFDVLPPSDAVGLLNGEDHTGLVPWEGTLRMLQWLHATHFVGHLRGPHSSVSAVRVVELGCGCGLGSMGVAHLASLAATSLCQTDSESATMPPQHWSIVATDGNDECVALASRNLALWRSMQSGAKAISLEARLYQWSENPDAARELLLPRCIQGPADNRAVPRADDHGDGGVPCPPLRSTCTVIAAGDVIYCPEMVTPLFGALNVLSVTAAKLGSPLVKVVFSYVPRSLTSATNQAIYESVLEQFREQVAAGIAKEVTVFALLGDDDSSAGDTTWCRNAVDVKDAPLHHTPCLFHVIMT